MMRRILMVAVLSVTTGCTEAGVYTAQECDTACRPFAVKSFRTSERYTQTMRCECDPSRPWQEQYVDRSDAASNKYLPPSMWCPPAEAR